MADAPALTCPECATSYPPTPDEPHRCDCGHPLELDADTEPGPSVLREGTDPMPYSRLDDRLGPWAFEEFLGVSRRVTLGEGFTPLVKAPNWNAEFKLEYVSPTGSFKDRGAATVVSRAVELGVECVLEDSSGNAGAAVATYAARAGLDAEVYVPADVPEAKLAAVRRSGASPIRVAGSREDVTAACVEAVDSGEGWYASHAWHPAFLSGTKTFALETVAERGWTAPDAVVLPVGHGTLLLGAYRGFVALSAAELIDTLPALYAAQAAGYAPVAAALGESLDGVADNEVADAVHVREPARMDELVAAVRDTGGGAVALGEDRVERQLDELHRAGFYVEPTCAAGPAALEVLRSRGAVGPDDDVVVPLTGTGLKTA